MEAVQWHCAQANGSAGISVPFLGHGLGADCTQRKQMLRRQMRSSGLLGKVSLMEREYTTGLQGAEETLCRTLCVIPLLGNPAGKTLVLKKIKISLRQQG